jgi:hypothetical protein
MDVLILRAFWGDELKNSQLKIGTFASNVVLELHSII